MFNSLRGQVSGRSGDTLYLLTGGVEWELSMPLTDIENLGNEARIFTWLHHTEKDMRLFGFADAERRSTFLELQKVEGIGPRAALKIMSGISQAELERALEAGDVARLEQVPGLGKKTAQKMVLALKGKLVHGSGGAVSASPYGELIKALVDMGYDRKSAAAALEQAASSLKATNTLKATSSLKAANSLKATSSLKAADSLSGKPDDSGNEAEMFRLAILNLTK
jgi:Holliday junction DNA helicase RuvA